MSAVQVCLKVYLVLSSTRDTVIVIHLSDHSYRNVLISPATIIALASITYYFCKTGVGFLVGICVFRRFSNKRFFLRVQIMRLGDVDWSKNMVSQREV